MGCVSSTEPHEVEVYGQRVQAKSLKPFEESEKVINKPPVCPLTGWKVAPGESPRLPSFPLTVEFPKSFFQVSPGVGNSAWSSSKAKYLNKALVSAVPTSVFCGREQVLFAAPNPKGITVVTSTGWVLWVDTPQMMECLRGKKTGFLRGAHVLRVMAVSVNGTQNDDAVGADVAITTGVGCVPDAPAALPFALPGGGSWAPEQGAWALSFDRKDQAAKLVGVMRTLRALFRCPPFAEVMDKAPQGFEASVPKATPPLPCDGGFYACFLGICTCLGVPMLGLATGAEFLTGLPMLDLNISAFEPVKAGNPAQLTVVGYAMRTALLATGFFNAITRNGAPMSMESWQQLLPAMPSGKVLKLNFAGSGLSPVMVGQLCDAMLQRGHNTIADLNLSGTKLSAEGAGKLAGLLEKTAGGFRRVVLSDCGLTAAMPIMKVLGGAKCKKLELLDLSNNNLADPLTPHPLAGIWKSPALDTLNLANTKINVEQVMTSPAPFKVAALRYVNLSGTAFPAPTSGAPLGRAVAAFFSELGASIEACEVTGCLASPDVIAKYMEVLGKKPSPLLTVNLQGMPNARAGVEKAAKAGPLPGQRLVMDVHADVAAACTWFRDLDQAVTQQFCQAAQQQQRAGPARGAGQMMVQVPNGAYPGTTLQVQAPDGRTIQVQVPPNVRPGMQFAVQLPPAAAPVQATPVSGAGDVQKKIAEHALQMLRQGTARDPGVAGIEAFGATLASEKGRLQKLALPGRPAPPQCTVTCQVQAGIAVAQQMQMPVPSVGAGPALALLLPGLAASKTLTELDITGQCGGDALGVTLGAVFLRTNRSVRSVKVGGNFFTHNSWAAIRGAFYGNMKVLEFPFPQEDADARIRIAQTVMQGLENQVIACRAQIKRAFKSTKGARTPYVMNTLNTQVEHIKGHKTNIARIRLGLQKYAKLNHEIQQAIQRNQKAQKNIEQLEKQSNKSAEKGWKEADRALEKATMLQKQKDRDFQQIQTAMWSERRSMLAVWSEEVTKLKKAKKDVSWWDQWVRSATKEGAAQPVLSGESAETLLALVPSDQRSKLKDVIKRTEKFIGSEMDILANQELMRSKIEEQKLVAGSILSQPGMKAPPPGQFKNIAAANNNGIIKGTVVVPPSSLVKPAVVAQAAPVMATPVQVQQAAKPGEEGASNQPAASTAQPLVQGQPAPAQAVQAKPVGQTLVMGIPMGIPVAAPVQDARYEQYKVYQAQQQQRMDAWQYQQAQQYGGGPGAYGGQQYGGGPGAYGGQQYGGGPGAYGGQQYGGGPGAYGYDDSYGKGYGKGKNNALMYGAGGAGMGFMGAYMYSSWYHQHHYGYGYGYYGGYYHHHHHYHDYHDTGSGGGVFGDEYAGPDVVETGVSPDVVEVEAMEADVGLGMEDPDPSADVDVGGLDVEAAGEDVDMYAGGEDRRPGGRAPPRGRAAARLLAESFKDPIPPRLDLAEWFREKIEGAQRAAREAALGRGGRLPLPSEVLLRTCGLLPERRAAAAARTVCLVTQCSVDRLPRLQAQLESWDGEVSVAVFVDAPRASLEASEARSQILLACSRAAAARAEALPDAPPPLWTVTAVYQIGEEDVRCPAYDRLYPVNALRNVALAQAEADLTFLLDVDFVPSRGLHGRLCAGPGAGPLREALRAGGAGGAPVALVVPAFEVKSQRSSLPRDQASLREACGRSDAEAFHAHHFPKGHRATDFARWFAGPSGAAPGGLTRATHGVDTYPVEYEEQFEPYVVVAREATPAYDERFRGYGLNKISHLYSLAAAGFAFHVLDDNEAFVVAGHHPRSKSWLEMYGPDADMEQRARLATHWAEFKREHGAPAAGRRAVPAAAAPRLEAPAAPCAAAAPPKQEALAVPGPALAAAATAALLAELLSRRGVEVARMASLLGASASPAAAA